MKKPRKKYIAIIKNGLDWRLFDSPDMCSKLMGLDKTALVNHCDHKGYFSGVDFTIFQVTEETEYHNRGYY